MSTLSPNHLWPGRGHRESKFVAAGSGTARSKHGIRLQRYKVRVDQRRQYISLNEFNETYTTAAARRFPHGTFFFHDEPDANGPPVAEYAQWYKRFVTAIKRGSAQARVSPAGFVAPDSFQFANEFFQVIQLMGLPVDEWRFHCGYNNSPDSYADFEDTVERAVEWSRTRGARLVLGSFGSPFVYNDEDMRDYQRRAMEKIKQCEWIVEAVWWTYDRGFNPPLPSDDPNCKWGYYHGLINPDGTLTRDGEVFVELM